MANTKHIPVLLKEVLDFFVEGDIFVDVTVGFGGHSKEILNKFPEANLYGIDRDRSVLREARKNLYKNKDRVKLKQGNYKDIDVIFKNYLYKADGILADLGVSSMQLDQAERGFSFKRNGPLDMRMDQSSELTAYDIVMTYSEKDLEKIFFKYGEEKFGHYIAKNIVRERKLKEIETTDDLKKIIVETLPEGYLKNLKKDPATKVFQALRIEVNEELKSLEIFLEKAVEYLKPGGILEIITFHSLEDKIVKEFLKRESRECICPKELPVCGCEHKKSLKILTKKPVLASFEELRTNPRSRSAKLRVAQKLNN